MDTSIGRDRFFSTTRGKIVELVRSGPKTVIELAEALGLTDNGVRAHLAALERDGLVRQGEPRRGVGKPAFTYVLAPAAERLYPKAYGTLMRQLLDVLGEQLPDNIVEAALREVGRRVASERLRVDGDPRTRVEAAAQTLGDLGGLAEVEANETGFVIHGCSCPLAALVEDNPAGCALAEALLSELTGLPVRQCCDQGPPARCCFAVALPPGPAGTPTR